MSGPRYTLVVGAGATGRSVVRHLAGRDALMLVDSRGRAAVPDALTAEFPELVICPGADRAGIEAALAARLPDIARAIISPGLADDHWLLEQLRAAAVPLATDIDLFFDALTSDSASGDGAWPPVIGITGTNGKSTVTVLTRVLLQQLGLTARAGGNLGPPALDLLCEGADVYVLELSSFQLARSRPAPLRVACVLNVEPDHLDYHGSLKAYAAAKQRVYERARWRVSPLDEPLAAAAQPDLEVTLAAPAAGQLGITAAQQGGSFAIWPAAAAAPRALAPVAALKLAGAHNRANAAMALALVLAFDPDADAAALAQGLAHFAGLPHRCEVVGHIAGVRYINDSKATNVSATAAAIAGLRDPQGALLVLLGGDGKGADFSVLGPVLADGVRAALLYGAAASELAAALAGQVPVYRCETLRAALAQARALARTGDTVLLSPACASFDQFANFEARGDAFRTAVAELAA